MYKQHLLNNIEKEINICRRLYTKILPDQMDFRPKEGVRSTLELLFSLEALEKSWCNKLFIGQVRKAYLKNEQKK